MPLGDAGRPMGRGNVDRSVDKLRIGLNYEFSAPYASSADSWSIRRTGFPAATHPSRPPASGRTFLNPFVMSARAARAAEASFGHVQ